MSVDLQGAHYLIEIGFSGTAKTLMRTQIERIATIAYLRKSQPSETLKWAAGYKTAEDRPNWRKRLAKLDPLCSPLTGEVVEKGGEFKAEMFVQYESLHAMVHGDRESAWHNAKHEDLNTYLATGSNPFNLSIASATANLAGLVTAYLIQELHFAFPFLKTEYLGQPK